MDCNLKQVPSAFESNTNTVTTRSTRQTVPDMIRVDHAPISRLCPTLRAIFHHIRAGLGRNSVHPPPPRFTYT